MVTMIQQYALDWNHVGRQDTAGHFEIKDAAKSEAMII